jgi:hypothetical protein
MNKNDPWNGSNVRKARAAMSVWLANRGSMPCGKCGLPVSPADKWVVGHKKSRHAYPELLMEASNWQPEHAACSNRSGHDAKLERADRIAREAAPGAFSPPDPQATAPGSDLSSVWPELTWREVEPIPDDEWTHYLAAESEWVTSEGRTDPPQLRRVVVVTGPPGAGKTTFAQWIGEWNWMPVFDRDDPQWTSESDFLAAIVALRYDRHAWAVVIRTAPTQADQDKWIAFLGATDLCIIDPGREETSRRIRARGSNVKGLIAGANDWYARA